MSINERGYWETYRNDSHIYDIKLCKCIEIFLKENNVKSIVDLGCGTGEYASNFINSGIQCDAYDGNPNTTIITNGIGKVLDLSINIDLGRNYDCVLSLEVGEHIPQKYESIFINNLCKHSNKWIILSWAIVGQIGYGHVNCRNNDYIIEKIANKGFTFKQDISDLFRKNSTTPWFKNTTMVFQKNT
jgi:hypothetical protein